jgi:lysine-specific permease
MSMIKVTTIVIFVVVGILRIFGAIGDAVYFSNFVVGDAPLFGGFSGILEALVVAGFTFQGTEMIGMTAGEAADPSRSIPKAIGQVFWRILLFYILTLFVIGCLIPYDDPSLLGGGSNSVAKSPFTLVFEGIGVPVAKHVMNAVILSAELSAANSGTYTGSRLLYAMGTSGTAPAFLGRTTAAGVPIFALLAIIGIAMLVYALSRFAAGAYEILIDASSAAGFLAWFVIAICHLRFRWGYVIQGYDPARLVYKARWFPMGPVVVIGVSLVTVSCMNIELVRNGEWVTVLMNYIGLIIFGVLYAVYRIVKKTKVIPYPEMVLHGEPEQPTNV